MSSPNEPGQKGAGEGSGAGNGAADRAATRATAPVPRVTDSGEVPPWQRGAGRAQSSASSRPQPPAEAPARDKPEARPDARVSRYITGTAAPSALQGTGKPSSPPAEADPTPGRPERNKEYASELPDLSGPQPRPAAARREAADRPEPGPARPSAGSRIQVGSRAKAGPVRASMQIRRIDPWSTLKVSLLLSVALFFVWMIAVAFLYLVLGGMGVWTKLNSNVGDLLTSTGGGGGELVSSGTIFGGALLIGLVNIVVLTAMATIGAFIYNLSTDIVGGVEVTLADRD
ncbi:DUF3566 domain-containing protein [Mycolicibacterium sp.]|uniref:DUF3566 domain-containing protein n=1 Tax=Mycolicibacterium sp. TaxID=2320850 RepID=UPI003560F800